MTRKSCSVLRRMAQQSGIRLTFQTSRTSSEGRSRELMSYRQPSPSSASVFRRPSFRHPQRPMIRTTSSTCARHRQETQVPLTLTLMATASVCERHQMPDLGAIDLLKIRQCSSGSRTHGTAELGEQTCCQPSCQPPPSRGDNPCRYGFLQPVLLCKRPGLGSFFRRFFDSLLCVNLI